MSATIDKLREDIKLITPTVDIDPIFDIETSGLCELHFLTDFRRAYEDYTGLDGGDIVWNIGREIFAWRIFDRYSL